jgi:hypothetical protein
MILAMQGGKGKRMWREEQVKKRSKRNPATTKTRRDARPPSKTGSFGTVTRGKEPRTGRMDGAGARRQSQESGLSRQVQSVLVDDRTCFTLVGKWVEGGKVDGWASTEYGRQQRRHWLSLVGTLINRNGYDYG